MLVDEVTITVTAGKGGDGARAFLNLPNSAKTPADGGNGGRGGDIFVKGSHNVADLSEFRFTKTIEAENGTRGGRQNLYGKNGEDRVIELPLGTHVTNKETGESFEIVDEELTLVAKGGAGGLGNKQLFAKPEGKRFQHSMHGQEGEEKELFLELKFIADIGLVGYPNAGKSSMLASITNANPTIGNYPFTTLHPILGVLDGITIADIPGLIEGASEGRGLGIQFLKHIEKTRMLLHLIDATSDNLVNQYEAVRAEFKGFKDGLLLEKEELIVLSKSDLVENDTMAKKIAEFKKINKKAVPFSIYSEKEITQIKELIKTHA